MTNAKTNKIITIGRQFGSGGHEIGRRIAKRMNIPCYDKEVLMRAAEENNLDVQALEKLDEKPKRLLYSLLREPYMLPYYSSYEIGTVPNPITIPFDTLRNIAQEGPCVIIGRCADYVLRDYDCLNLFIYAPLEDRIARKSKLLNISAEEAADQIAKTDKLRASYYNFYTQKKWSDIDSYDYCINSSFLGIEGTVDLLEYILSKAE